MTALHVLALQWAISFTVYSMLARWFVAPYLRSLSARAAVLLLALPHLLRHLSLVSLAPGVAVARTMPRTWALAVSIGDLTTLALAVLTIGAIHARKRAARPLAWTFNLVGALDILHVAFEARRHAIVEHLGAQWFVVTMGVPMLVVSHILAFTTLTRRNRELARELSPPSEASDRDGQDR